MKDFGVTPSSSTRGQDEAELLYLIERYLASGPCQDAAKALREEIDRHELLPARVDFDGRRHQRSFAEYEQLHRHLLPNNLLAKIWQRVRPLLESRASIGEQQSLGVDRQLFLRTKGSAHTRWACEALVANRNHELLLPPVGAKKKPHFSRLMVGRELGGHNFNKKLIIDGLVPRLEFYTRVLGHLSSVFCVSFDRLGQYVFTGADDNLIKVWSAFDGRLLFTFRGFQGEVSDLTVSHENTLLAAGSCDKSIRVWCLKTGSPVATLQGHSAVVTSLQFLPYVNGDVRYLVSTGNDCCVCFWKWNASTNVFDPTPVKYAERLRVGGQMICSSHSAGGLFIATGGTDHYVRVYTLKNGFPERILEVEGHTERVDSLQWAHRGLKFVTGSKDGQAKIWTFERMEWRTQLLSVNPIDQKTGDVGESGSSQQSNAAQKAQKLKVTMVAWSLDDTLVITGASDTILRVWDARTATLLRTLNGHTEEAFVLEPHPIHANLLLSAGHDGNLIIWNLLTGDIVKKHYNAIEGLGHGAFFDCRFSPDGSTIAAVDSHGHLTLLGLGSNEAIKEVPREQFFHTDYRPLLRDANNYVVDEQTQTAPHLMPPPFLVNSDGDPYPPRFQRLVPGRERCSDSFLIPYIVGRRAGAERGDADGEAPPANMIADDVVANGSNQEQVCAWASRPLIRIFSPSVYTRSVDLRQSLKDDEFTIYECELNKPALPPAPLPTVESVLVNGVGRRRRAAAVRASAHVGRPRASAAAAATPALATVATPATTGTAAETEPAPSVEVNHVSEESDSASNYSSDDEGSTTSSNESETSDPEYSDSSGPRTRLRAKKESDDEEKSEPPSRHSTPTIKEGKAKRSPPRRERERERERAKVLNSETPSTSYSNGDSHRPKRRRVRMLSDSEDMAEGNGNGNGNGDVAEKPRKSRTKRIKRVTLDEEPQSLSDVPKQYAFPEWITCTMPRKAPYFPQIGDKIVYFSAGHRLYVEAVQRLAQYTVKEKQLPWNRVQLQPEEFAVVDDVRFELQPVRLCCLKLKQVNPKTNRPTGVSYVVRYHDIPAVVDFFVLRQHYEASLERRWKPGDRFQAVIDDSWWFGSIKSRESTKTHFQALQVIWDTGEEERMSPWDLEPIDTTKCRSKKTTSVAASPDELLRLGSYTADDDDWPEHGMETEVERLLKGIERIMEFALAEPFAAPVDLNAYPQYCLSIEYPSDLSTIKERLENRFYRRQRAFRFDVVQIAKNAAQFNERLSTIVKRARLLVEILLKYFDDPSCDDIVTIHNEVMSASSITTGLRTMGPSIAEDGSADDSSNGRRLRRRKYIKEYAEADGERELERESGRKNGERKSRMKRLRYRDNTTDDDDECDAAEVVVSTSMRGRLRKIRKFT